MEVWALEHGKEIWFSPAGDLSWPDFEFDRGAQRAGDTVVSWAVFFNTQEVAGFALVATVQTPASGEPGHGAFDGPAVPAQALAGVCALASVARRDATGA